MNEKLDKLAGALDWDISGISVDTALDSLQWDSMAMLTVISLARMAGKKVSGAEIREMKTVGDVLAVM